MELWSGKNFEAYYSRFVVDKDGFLSSIGHYHGDAGDALSPYLETYWDDSFFGGTQSKLETDRPVRNKTICFMIFFYKTEMIGF